MTKYLKIAIVSLAVLGAASSAHAVDTDFNVDTLLQEQSLLSD